VLLVPDVDYRRMLAELSAGQRRDPAGVGAWLAGAWPGAYCSQVPDSLLPEFDEVATFLFDQAGATVAPQADRTIAARGLSGGCLTCTRSWRHHGLRGACGRTGGGMSLEIGLWRAGSGAPVRVGGSGLPLESRLEELIQSDPTMPGESLLMIGSQVPTARRS
jgi:hypothetical protein